MFHVRLEIRFMDFKIFHQAALCLPLFVLLGGGGGADTLTYAVTCRSLNSLLFLISLFCWWSGNMEPCNSKTNALYAVEDAGTVP